MKLLDDFLKIFKKFDTNPQEFKPVPKWAHPGKKGKTIYCPKCMHDTHVGHFAWSTMVCSKCKTQVNKYEWLLLIEEEKGHE